MKKFDTLYKRTKTSAIQQWTIEVVTKTSHGNPVIKKQSGQLNGQLITHNEVISEGKNIGRANETTPLKQALFMAESDWKKKKDEGYKSLEDLGITAQADTDDVNPTLLYYYQSGVSDSLDIALNRTLPKFNSDSNGNAKPMLATAVEKIKNIEYPVLIQPKLDGVRCLMIVAGEESPSITFLSRSGKEYTSLSHIETDILRAWDPGGRITSGFILDGEVYSEELNFQEIVSAVKAFKPNSLKLHFRAYDIVSEHVQEQRLKHTENLVKAIGSAYIHFVETHQVNSWGMVKQMHDKWVQEGNEGAMIRLPNGKYGQGQRSRDLIKVKEFDETEFVVTGTEFGQRGIEDLIILCETDSGSDFKAKMQGSKIQKEELYNQISTWFSQDDTEVKATIKHFGWTEDKLPRFPIGKGIRDYD